MHATPAIVTTGRRAWVSPRLNRLRGAEAEISPRINAADGAFSRSS